LGGAGSDVANSISQTSDGGYILAGSADTNIASLGGQSPLNAYSAGNDSLVVKLSSTGSVSWYTFLGGAGADSATSIAQASDGGYILAGFANANIPILGGQTPLNAYAADNDYVVIKLIATGAVAWYTFFGSSGADIASSVQATLDGGYIVAGKAGASIPSLGGQTPVNAYSTFDDYFLVKLKSNGDF